MKRILLAAVTAGLCAATGMTGQSAGAASTSPSPEVNDIAFRDIFTFVARHVSATSTRDDFESGALRSMALRTQGATSATMPVHFTYSYGSYSHPKEADYSESPSDSGTAVTFEATDFSEVPWAKCLTFGEARAILLASGWAWRSDDNDRGDRIGMTYRRGGVTMSISDSYAPMIVEFWQGADAAREQLKARDDYHAQREKTKPRSPAFLKTCVEITSVAFTRHSAP